VAGGSAWAVSKFWEATVSATDVATWLAISVASGVGGAAGAQAARSSERPMMVNRIGFMDFFMQISFDGSLSGLF
jgi:hypothetical protein